MGTLFIETSIQRRSCQFIAVMLLAACPPSFSQIEARQLAQPDRINRNPTVSDTGLIVWQTTGAGQNFQTLGEDSHIVLYDGTDRKILSDEIGEGSVSHIHPAIHGNTLVWQGLLSDRRTGGDYFTMVPPQDASGNSPHMRTDYELTYTISEEGGTVFTNAAGIVRTNQLASGGGSDPNFFPAIQNWRDAPSTNQANGTGGRTPGGGNDIVIWSATGGAQRVIGTPQNDVNPQVYGNLIAWQAARGWPFGWEIMAFDGEEFFQLTTNYYYDMGVDVGEDRIVWYGWDGDDFEIFLYRHDEKTIRQITDNNYDDVNPRVDGDTIVWEGYQAVEADIFIWTEGGAPERLSRNIEDDLAPRISGGEVVWQGFDGDDFEIYRYDGEQIIKLTQNDFDDVNPEIDEGLITWMGYEGNWDSEIFIWNGQDVVMVTSNDYEDRFPQAAGGRIVWQADDFDESFIYTAEPGN